MEWRTIIKILSILFTLSGLVAAWPDSPESEAERDPYGFMPNETSPTFNGDAVDMISFLATLEYPAEALALKVEDKVYLHFFIEEDGTVTHPHIPPHFPPGPPVLVEAAKAYALKMPKWKPGTEDGSPKRTLRMMRIEFLPRYANIHRKQNN